MRPLLAVLLLATSCAAAPLKPDTIYRPKRGGAIDLSANKFARHCSDLTKDFRHAYSLEEAMRAVLSVTVSGNAERVSLRTDEGQVSASRLVNDHERIRAFWYYDDWTLAVTLDHLDCSNGACPAEFFLIKYNGAKTPSERVSKLCFEKWAGTFMRADDFLRTPP